jgi:hypothetical protein
MVPDQERTLGADFDPKSQMLAAPELNLVYAQALDNSNSEDGSSAAEDWLDLEHTAAVEVTSEEEGFPVESALLLGETRGWRAASSGAQILGLVFDQPQTLKRISLVFEEEQTERTQEFVLRWSSDKGRSFREIVRQQWNFSPPNTIREAEEYQVDFPDVSVLELIVVPHTSGGPARASLKSLRLR